MFEQSPHFHFEQLDSTNNYASTIVKLPETRTGTAITADFQLEGRGQRDNKWLAEAGSSFLGTLIIKVQLNPEDIFFLSKWSALQVAKTLIQQNIHGVTIKWPNDIFVEGKKIGGILIENSWSDQKLHYSLIGIGINLSASPIENATNFSEHSNEVPSTVAFLQTLRKQMDADYFLLEGNRPAIPQPSFSKRGMEGISNRKRRIYIHRENYSRGSRWQTSLGKRRPILVRFLHERNHIYIIQVEGKKSYLHSVNTST